MKKVVMVIALMLCVSVANAGNVTEWLSYNQVGYSAPVNSTSGVIVDGRAWGADKLRAELDSQWWVCSEPDIRDCVVIDIGETTLSKANYSVTVSEDPAGTDFIEVTLGTNGFDTWDDSAVYDVEFVNFDDGSNDLVGSVIWVHLPGIVAPATGDTQTVNADQYGALVDYREMSGGVPVLTFGSAVDPALRYPGAGYQRSSVAYDINGDGYIDCDDLAIAHAQDGATIDYCRVNCSR